MSTRSMLRGIFRRAVLTFTTPVVGALQRLQAAAGDDVISDVEHAEPYGLATRPPAGAPVFLAAIGADESSLVALCVGDASTRPAALVDGEVALYNSAGQQVLLTSTAIKLGPTATLGVARSGDTVQVTIPANTFGTHAPVVVAGTITAGSSVVKAA